MSTHREYTVTLTLDGQPVDGAAPIEAGLSLDDWRYTYIDMSLLDGWLRQGLARFDLVGSRERCALEVREKDGDGTVVFVYPRDGEPAYRRASEIS